MIGATKGTAAMKDDYMMDRALAVKMSSRPKRMPAKKAQMMRKMRRGA